MAIEREKKVFAGARVRQLRLAMGLTQTAMAQALGVSGSYLNLVERNQRPLTTQLLLRLAEVYDLDLRDLRGDEQARVAAEMTEALTDPVFAGRMPTSGAIIEVASGQPDMAAAFLSLYAAYRKAVVPAVEAGDGVGAEADRQRPPGVEPFPIEEVRDQFHRRNNYVVELDDAAEALHGRLGGTDDLFSALRDHLREKHGVKTIIMPVNAMPEAQRRFDAEGRRLLLSEMLPMSSRVFQLGVQVALLSEGALIDRLVAAAPLRTDDARRLYRIGLANHFGGALMMPYGRFIDAAEAVRFDIDVLASRFGASVEQVAHRLTTLQRKDRRGVPFFLLRLDNAGNISKRFAAGGFHFARFGGTCPRWRVYDAFATPGQTIVQQVELPDGTRYLTISRTVETLRGPYPNARRKLAISLGCEISHAGRIVYGDGLDLADAQAATPIGVTCRMCERGNCPARAFPPMTRPLTIDADRKGFSAFEFG